MRAVNILVALGLLALLTGCSIPSLQPLYTEEDVVFEPALLGTWSATFEDGEAIALLEPAKDTEKLYWLTYKDKSGVYTYEARLVRLGDSLFLDVYPVRDDWERFLASFPTIVHAVPTHTFYRLKIEKDVIEVAYFDHDWVEKKLNAGELDIAHGRAGHDADIVVLAASAKDLQALLSKYAEDEEAFEPIGEFHRLTPR